MSRAAVAETREATAVSDLERRQPVVRLCLRLVQTLVLAGLVVAGLAPLLWVLRAAVSSTQDIIRNPLALLPTEGFHWENIPVAWEKARVGMFLANTAVIAVGSAVVTLIVCLTAAYVLSILRPRWAPILNVAIMVTLFVPGVIALVPLYLTVLDVPLVHVSLLNSYWAIWLPASANAFLILIVKRFFDAIPRELFEAARIDGAGSLRVFLSIVLPLSRPIIGVVALLTIMASWKDFLWPMLVLQDPATQPISVALAKIADNTPLNIQIAAMLLALLVPVVLFLTFQRQFLAGVGLTGATKG